MIIQPKVRGFICLSAHKQGCAANVAEQISYVKQNRTENAGPKNVLVIGGSTGYGLASAITAAFGYDAKTLSIFFEKPPKENKTASAGYYNAAAFQAEARNAGLQAQAINGDAFSTECKQAVIDRAKQNNETFDLVVYSLASPRRTDPQTGETFKSVLKPIGQDYTYKNLNTDKLTISDTTIEPASEEEIANTIKVMGGEDWELWIEALSKANVLSQDFQTVAYTYLGEKITWPIYGHGTIGKAKEDLDRAAATINTTTGATNARLGVLKALVTQASSAIPTMPLYLSLLYKAMKEAGTHEGCIEQISRLFIECLYSDTPRLDKDGRYRVDNFELQNDIQKQVISTWPQVTEENLYETTDYAGYRSEFLKLFGFGRSDIDYEADCDPLVELDAITL